jgi:spore maturation protein CgeB
VDFQATYGDGMKLNRLSIITVDYASRYNIGNYHLNEALARRFKEHKYFFLEKGFKQKKNEEYFKASDLIFINRPLRKTKHLTIEGDTFRNLNFTNYVAPVVLFDTDSQALKMQERVKYIKRIGVNYLALGNNDFRVAIHRGALPEVDTFYFHFGVNTEHFKNFGNRVREIPSGFIGSYRNHYYPNRLQMVDRFKHRMGDRFFWKRMIKKEYVHYLNNMGIFVTANDLDMGFFMKHLESMSCGCMLLAEYTPLFEKLGFIDGEDLVTWTTLDDCEQKLMYYLAYDEPRKVIAKNGEKKARTFTWESRVSYLLDRIKDG